MTAGTVFRTRINVIFIAFDDISGKACILLWISGIISMEADPALASAMEKFRGVSQ
jgi:hypothetical protein